LNPQLQPANAKILHFANKRQFFGKKQLETLFRQALDGSATGFQHRADPVEGPATREPKPTKQSKSSNMLIPLTPAMFGARLADGQAEISGNFDRVSRAIF